MVNEKPFQDREIFLLARTVGSIFLNITSGSENVLKKGSEKSHFYLSTPEIKMLVIH